MTSFDFETVAKYKTLTLVDIDRRVGSDWVERLVHHIVRMHVRSHHQLCMLSSHDL